MGDAELVSMSKSFGDLRGITAGLIDGQGAFLQALFEVFAFQVFHHQKINAVLMTNVMEGANVGMREFGNSFGFTLQPLPQRIVGRKVRR